jgi:hypothetical protein
VPLPRAARSKPQDDAGTRGINTNGETSFHVFASSALTWQQVFCAGCAAAAANGIHASKWCKAAPRRTIGSRPGRCTQCGVTLFFLSSEKRKIFGWVLR